MTKDPPARAMATTIDCAGIVRMAPAVVAPQFPLSLHHGAHGTAHWSRVWFHGRALAVSLDVNPAVLAWFASLRHSPSCCTPRTGSHVASRQDTVADFHQAASLRRAKHSSLLLTAAVQAT